MKLNRDNLLRKISGTRDFVKKERKQKSRKPMSTFIAPASRSKVLSLSFRTRYEQNHDLTK